MVQARKKRDRKVKSDELLDLTGLPISVVKHYRACAQKLDMSVTEYLVLKLTHDCYVDVVAVAATKRPDGRDTIYASKAEPAVATTKSGYKGVYAYGKRWAAVVFVNGTRQRLGVWDTPDEAAHAYDNHLIAAADGDPNVAVNFPSPLDDLQTAGAAFVERFATGEPLTDIEHAAWQRSTQSRVVPDRGGLSILPPTTDASKINANMPLMNRPAIGLHKRTGSPVAPKPRDPTFIPAELPPPITEFVPPPLDDPDA